MGIVIRNNVQALNAQHSLTRASDALSKSLERLSTGMRINRGADGPAALVISELQRAQIAGLQTAIDNSQKAVSLVQTAEGALSEINSLMVKIRSLALDSANSGVNNTDALAANQSEISNALSTIDRIANNTQFANKKLLDGSAGPTGTADDADVTFLTATTDTMAGTYAVAVTTRGERAKYTAGTAQTGNLAADETLIINGVSISLAAGLNRAQVQARINEYTGQTGVIAEDDPTVANSTRLRTQAFGSNASLSVKSDTAAAATSTGFGTTQQTDSGVDIAGTIGGIAASGSGNTLTATSGAGKGIAIQLAADTDAAQTVTGANGDVTIVNNSLTFQIGPNQNQTVSVAIGKVNTSALGLGIAGNQFTNLSAVDVTSQSKAQDALAVIDEAIDNVTSLRGTLGAFQQNTLESTANNMRTTLENSIAAESLIRDTDFAAEIAKFTQNQVLTQAGTSVLQSANQIPQLVLSLLGG